MNNTVFITYGDSGYEAAKAKILSEADATGIFDELQSYGPKQLSPELLSSEIMKIKRGGGLWSWKADVILSTMLTHEKGTIIVYCDAGCSLSSSREWSNIKNTLKDYDIICQRLYQRTDKWTRKELTDYFSSNGKHWLYCYQFLATVVILVVSDFTINLIKEWRDTMINNPLLVKDVEEVDYNIQRKSFIENRHDQAIFSALIYKYLSIPEYRNKIYTQWEHIEDLDPFFHQAIRATRLRQGEQETVNHKRMAIVKRIIKDYCFKPFYYAPIQWWYSR